MKFKWPRKKTVLCLFLGLMVLCGAGMFGGIQYIKHQFFGDRPNALTLEGELFSVAFEWSEEKYENHTEPHGAILIPVTVPGITNTFYMQFDTGSPSTFLRSGAMRSLRSHGVEFELFETDEQTRVQEFELNIGGNRVLLNSGWVREREIEIDWDNPEAINVIGSIGADFIDQMVCEIDFPAREIRLYRSRPGRLELQGSFTPFSYAGRRIMLPVEIGGVDQYLFYDSGCSSFGLFTSKYHFDRLADDGATGIRFNANRFGNPVPIHHQPTDVTATFGDVELLLKRVSYVEQYVGVQSLFGRLANGGVLGNKSLTESTLILDAIANEFLIVSPSLRDDVEQPAEER